MTDLADDYSTDPDPCLDAGSRKQVFIRRVRRAVCAIARTRPYFTADDIAKFIPKPPDGVDGRNVGGALRGLSALGLIAPVTYARLDVKRAHGRPQALWRTLDPEGCAEWLRRNPPGPGDPPTTIQLTFF